MAFGDKPFGLKDVKVAPMSGASVDLPAAQRLKFGLRLKSGELLGDDSLMAVASYTEALEWELDAGGIDLAALAVITGISAASTGTTPNQVKTLNIDAGVHMPYFKIYGKSVGDAGTDDVHVKILKAKLTGTLEGEYREGQFFVTQCRGIGVDAGGGTGIVDIVQNETAASLPA